MQQWDALYAPVQFSESVQSSLEPKKLPAPSITKEERQAYFARFEVREAAKKQKILKDRQTIRSEVLQAGTSRQVQEGIVLDTSPATAPASAALDPQVGTSLSN